MKTLSKEEHKIQDASGIPVTCYEVKIQEALGILKRWKVGIYHNHIFRYNGNTWMSTWETDIYKTVYVFASNAEAACVFVSVKYGPRPEDYGVRAKKYVHLPFPMFVVYK